MLGTLGVGGGFVLGAVMARPGTEHWLLWGDGAAGFSLMEFDSYARQGVGVSELPEALAAAKAAARSGKPLLINVWLGKSEFCEGSLSM